MPASSNIFAVHPSYQPMIREIGLDAEAIFDDPRIVVWRKLADRENCTLDATLIDGRSVRFHIKRYPTPESAEAEVRGFQLLADEQIPTAPLVAHGRLSDNRSFVIFEDLTGYTPADKLVEAGTPFENLLNPTADLAASLHVKNLHHRDLYLCHFMARPDGNRVDVKLIDTARIGRLSNPLTRKRWIIKDLSQFWYSTTKLPASEKQRDRWLERYAQQRQTESDRLRSSIKRKARAIARHDDRLNLKQPSRNVSIPAQK